MQDLILAVITIAEKRTLMQNSTLNHDSHGAGHSAFLKSMSRTITMQSLTLAAITAAEKRTLLLDDVKS